MSDSPVRQVSQDQDNPVIWPRGLKPNDRFEVQVDSLWPDGSGHVTLYALVGPQKQPKRYHILVRQGLPGDKALIHVEFIKRQKAEARIVTLQAPSPLRQPPRCVHFGQREVTGKGCGGCILQSLTYQDQCAQKQQFALQALTHEGLTHHHDKVLPILGVERENQWYYRNKMEFSFGDYQKGQTLQLGLHPRGFKHDVLPLSECFLLDPFVPGYLGAIRDWASCLGLRHYMGRMESGHLKNLVVRQGKRTGEVLVDFVTTSTDIFMVGDMEIPAADIAQQFAQVTQTYAEAHELPIVSIYWTQHHTKRGERTTATSHLLAGKETLTEKMNLPGDRVLAFEIHPKSFFQPNTKQAERLYATILEMAGLLAEVEDRPKLALDLYCGTGTIALCLAPYIDHVVGAELREEAVENAVENARRNTIENATFFTGDVAKVFESSAWQEHLNGRKVDLVVVDPPRAGLTNQALEHVDQAGADLLIYVSCEPKSLARDIKKFNARGWTLEQIQPVDMFPHTRHLEQVAKLRRLPKEESST